MTGYGVQTSLYVPRIAALGHEVAISGPFSFSGAPLAWRGFTVYPGGIDPFGSDVIQGHYRKHNADLMITLCDVFMLDAAQIKPLNVACWIPVDCDPLGAGDRQKLWDSGAVPIAMSRFGERVLRKAGWDPYYVPHGVDLYTFKPHHDREKLRASMGIGPDTFCVGINAANKEGPRKRFFEQFAAFAAFHERHPDSRLAVHSMIEPRGGKNLRSIASHFGISDAVFFPDQYHLVTGMIDSESLAAWYSALDVLSNCSNEGFGLAMIEAQACGTPVVTMDDSTGPELVGPGWLVGGETDWVDGHESQWSKPLIDDIDGAYELAWLARKDGDMPAIRDKAQAFAAGYDADEVFARYWMPVLDALNDRRIKVIPQQVREQVTLKPAAKEQRHLLVIVPSRGRPERVARMEAVMDKTARAFTDLIFAFDADDPALEACKQASPYEVPAVSYAVGPRAPLSARVNDLALAYADDYQAVMFCGDADLPETPGWDKAILEALEAMGGGFCYPCDPGHPGVPSVMAASTDVVKVLGWLCEPSLGHSWLGNVWLELGKQSGCLAYLPDVEVADTPDEDSWPQVYEPALSTAADQDAYVTWRRERAQADIETLRRLRGGKEAAP